MPTKTTIAFIVPGEPRGKERPRFFKGKLGSFAYTPQKTVNYENWVKMCYLEHNRKNKLTGEISAHIIAYYKIPKQYSKKKRWSIQNGLLHPTKKPDADNLGKAILDSLNHIAYDDDSQIIKLIIEKHYSDEPRVEVELTENGTL
jgi:Holliday junction resolvase RusA-like endonuclease